jgi:hypothetical protein
MTVQQRTGADFPGICARNRPLHSRAGFERRTGITAALSRISSFTAGGQLRASSHESAAPKHRGHPGKLYENTLRHIRCQMGKNPQPPLCRAVNVSDMALHQPAESGMVASGGKPGKIRIG